MKNFTLLPAALAVLLALPGLKAGAQKPTPSGALELKLVPESETSRIEGNMRILERTNKPVAIYRGTYRVTIAGDPETKARQYLSDNKALLGLSTADINSLRLHAVRNNEGGTIVRLRQTWRGLDVNNNAEITIHITPDNIVDFVQNGFQYGITMNDITALIPISSARQQVFDRLGITTPVRDEKNTLMMLRYQNNDHLVHRISFNTDTPVGDWEAYVDAKTGALMKVEDVSLYHKKKSLRGGGKTGKPLPKYTGPLAYKYPYPSKITATGTATIFDPDPLSLARATYGGSYIDNADAIVAVLTAQLVPVTLLDITFASGTHQLIGPYARVMDFEAPSKGLFSQASANFSTNRNADVFEAVMCYYHVDATMRHLNITLGLGIMPYQYAGGVRYDPSGLNGADNSHYMSSSGRFAMGEGGVDDAEDADVILHELGHGLHDWATDGGLSQVTGLSEGTGDYMSGGYSWSKGNWTPADPAYYYQYSWDGHNEFWAARELNFAGVYPTALVGEVHLDGRIWAAANLRIWTAIGRNRSDVVFWRGMMNTNSSSNQNDAANAVYQMSLTLGYTNAERYAIHSNYIQAGYTMPAFVVLPVKLVSFDAKKTGKQAMVTWKTAMEDNTESFTIERSFDGTSFSHIGTIPAAGNSTGERSYSFPDGAPQKGNNYYRLKTTDKDGATSYSDIKLLVFDKQPNLEIFPNPVHDVLTIRNTVSEGTVYIYDVNGKQVYMQKISSPGSAGINVDLSSLPNGVYVVKLQTGDQSMQSKIVKK